MESKWSESLLRKVTNRFLPGVDKLEVIESIVTTGPGKTDFQKFLAARPTSEKWAAWLLVKGRSMDPMMLKVSRVGNFSNVQACLVHAREERERQGDCQVRILAIGYKCRKQFRIFALPKQSECSLLHHPIINESPQPRHSA